MTDITTRMAQWDAANRAQSSKEIESILKSDDENHLNDNGVGRDNFIAGTKEMGSAEEMGEVYDKRHPGESVEGPAKAETADDTKGGKKNPIFGRVREAYKNIKDRISAHRDLKAANRLHDKGYKVESDSRDVSELYRYQKSNPYDIDMRIGAWGMSGLKDTETEMLLKSTSAQTYFKKSAMCQEMIDSMSEDELGEALIGAIEELINRMG